MQSSSNTCALKLATTYKMALMYFLVNTHIGNQSTLHKVNSVINKQTNNSLFFNKKYNIKRKKK
jgi:hypothetical protein